MADARLVTLTGPGGVGKTRLALRVAEALRRGFRDGVWLADLVSVPEGSLLEYVISGTVGLQDFTDRPVAEVLTQYLRGRQVLLVLDNCEHVLDACAAFAIRTLPAAPELRILCTSRQTLRVVGEHVWPVPPLPVPDARPHPPGGPWAADAAVELFVVRAGAVVPGFTLGPDNVAAVEDICRRLDGLPLAIELAASNLRALSVPELAAGLAAGSGHRSELLSARCAAPMHHRRLRDTFDWSFGLCTPAEQRLWTRLSVFAGSFDLDAVVGVCAGDDLPAAEMLDLVVRLVDKSIVLRVEATGMVRYRLLETVRQYGLDRLRAGDGLEPRLRLRLWRRSR